MSPHAVNVRHSWSKFFEIMKYLAYLTLTTLMLCGCANDRFSSRTPKSPELSAPFILSSMKKVADWQLTNDSPSLKNYRLNECTYGAFYAGVMALDDISDTP